MRCCWFSPSFVCGCSGALLVYCCITWLTPSVQAEVDPAWENVFRTRSDEDWRSVWHTERHRRCYHDLYEHMNWVCQKDIYAVRRRKKRSIPFQVEDQDDDDYLDYPFLDPKAANSFLGKAPSRLRRQKLFKRGIIDECCHATSGCSWEEYAEYCPANSRVRNT